jgi:hypothetical protein
VNVFPTERDIQPCLDLLIIQYKPDKMIKYMFGHANFTKLYQLLQSLGKEAVDSTDLAKLLITEKGAYLFSGSDQAVRELRKHL